MRKNKKAIVFHLVNGGGSYQALVFGDDNKLNWGKIDGKIIFDYQLKAVITDAKKDGYKCLIK
jgi:ABC-type taurine transport system ATPase subunit